MERKLTILLVADIVGYSARMERAEEETAKLILEFQNAITAKVEEHGGRVFNRAGDAALAEFASPVKALYCAVELKALGTSLRDEAGASQPVQLRIGLHLADIIIQGTDLTGDGVNIAARIQQAAQPGQILASEIFFNHVRRHSPFAFTDLGPQSFKNISEPHRLFLVAGLAPGARFLDLHVREKPLEQTIRAGSIALMPFLVEGTAEDNSYLAEGVAEDIIVELSRFRRLRIIARSATRGYDPKQIDLGLVGKELGVLYVLEGRVRNLGNSVGIFFKLSNTQSLETIWADRVTKPRDQIFEVVEHIVQKVVASVVRRLDTADTEAARRQPPQNLTAYDCVLRGLEFHRMGGVTVDNQQKAVDWFDQAIAADPNYGVAYAWRICARANLPEFDLRSNKHFIDRALALDSNNAEAHRIMATIAAEDGNLEVAMRHMKLAMELSPCDAYIKVKAAAIHIFKGQFGEALSLLDAAQELDPFLPVWCVVERAVALYAMGKYEESHSMLAGVPFSTERTVIYQVAALVALDRMQEADAAVARARADYSDLSVQTMLMKEKYANQTLRDELTQRLQLAGLIRSKRARVV